MNEASSTVLIRPARHADKEAVLAFTKQTWDWGDYIPYVWDKWLADPNSELSVAEMDGKVVAVTMTTRLSAAEGWLQGLRVHPDYRHHGVARRLTAYQLDLLRQWKVPVVRLAVYSHNIASQTLVAGAGFRRLTTFYMTEQSKDTMVASESSAEILAAGDVDNAWGMLTQSPTLRASAGLWARGWAWQRLTRDIVAEQVAQGQVFGVRDGNRWPAIALMQPDGDGQHIGYADGEEASLLRLAQSLMGLAKAGHAEFINSILPPAPHVRSAFRQAGYGGEEGGMYIYELELG